MTTHQQMRFWAIFVTILGFFLYSVTPILLPFVLGGLFAHFLSPLVERCKKIGLTHFSATLLVAMAFFALSSLLISTLFIILLNQIINFSHNIPDYVTALQNYGDHLNFGFLSHIQPSDLNQIHDYILGYSKQLSDLGLNALRYLLLKGISILNILVLMVITPIVTFYLLYDWERIITTLDLWLPQAYSDTIHKTLHEINETLLGFIRGQVIVCLVMGLFYAICLTLLRVNLGLLIGLVAGSFIFVPYLGHFIGLVSSVTLAYAQTGSVRLPLFCVMLFAVGLALEGYILTPKLIGGRTGLNPAWILFSVLTGASLFGFLGVLIALPTAAIIGVLCRLAIRTYLNSSLYLKRHKMPLTTKIGTKNVSTNRDMKA